MVLLPRCSIIVMVLRVIACTATDTCRISYPFSNFHTAMELTIRWYWVDVLALSSGMN